MPYQRPGHSRQVPSVSKTVETQFVNSDLSPGVKSGYRERTMSSQTADIDTLKEYHKLELACGCYWPDSEIGGVCSECATSKSNANTCKAHLVTCPVCGAAVCWAHSRMFPDDSGPRFCLACYRKHKRKALFHTVLSAFGCTIRLIFFKESE